jgi:hypothetical protein
MKDKYLLYFLSSPRLFPKLICILIKKIHRHLSKLIINDQHKLFSNKNFNTPLRREIGLFAKKVHIENIPLSSLKNLLNLKLEIKEGIIDLDSIMIPLATKEVRITDSFFNAGFEDQEDYFAANRFIWIYEIILNYPYKNVIDYCYEKIFQWLDENQLDSSDNKFESYSISERIIAFLFFIQFTKRYFKISKLKSEELLESLRTQLNHLINHLEYRGKMTNNHILNNARVLYITGRLLKLKDIENLGKKILKNEYALVFENGIYLEGSSHYQMLITKNFLEMQIVAKCTNDFKFQNLLDLNIREMLGQCNILQSRYSTTEFPLIGDISPDMAPNWFIGWPFNNKNSLISKWASLFKYELTEIIRQKKTIKNNTKYLENKKWLYIEKERFEVWASLRDKKIPCHGHNDNGSLIIYYDGKPFIIDLGLSTYHKHNIKEQQISYRAHNMPVINSNPKDIPSNSILQNTIKHSVGKLIYLDNNKMEYKIQYSNRNIVIKRQIIINKSTCNIFDKIENLEGLNVYKTSWTFKDIPKKIGTNKFSSNNIKIEFCSDNKIYFHIQKLVKRSIKYGEVLPAFVLSLETNITNNGIKIILS